MNHKQLCFDFTSRNAGFPIHIGDIVAIKIIHTMGNFWRGYLIKDWEAPRFNADATKLYFTAQQLEPGHCANNISPMAIEPDRIKILGPIHNDA